MGTTPKEKILDHYHHPRNFGTLAKPDISNEEDNPLCGDRIRIDIHINDGIIKNAQFMGEGCSVSIASASILTEILKGKSFEELKSLGKDEFLKELGIPLDSTRIRCGLLSLKVFQGGAYGIKEWPGEEDEDW
jgi:nitrogen fixation NifU-like protein